MGNTKALATELPRIDGDTQSRLKINDDVVSDYADLITEANGDWPFPPLDVFHDGTDYFVADGFHRLLGALRTKRGSVPCAIHKGTARDARIFGMTANDRHGLRMTRADKRACVEWLLDQPGKMTQKEVAEKAGVSVATVRNVVAERTPTSTNRGKKGNLPFNPPKVEPPGFDDDPEPPEPARAPAQRRANRSASGSSADYGKCPNCAGTKWDEDEEGVSCAKCHHPHGEPAGDVDEDNVKTQRQKTVKTVEALQRAFDDLNHLHPTAEHGGATKWSAAEVDGTLTDMGVVAACKGLLRIARGWK